LGPIQVKYSYAPELKEGTWYFNLGFWFWEALPYLEY
jgi:NTE family protein